MAPLAMLFYAVQPHGRNVLLQQFPQGDGGSTYEEEDDPLHKNVMFTLFHVMKLIRITHARSLTLAVVVAAAAGDAQAAPVFRTCTPTEVGAFNNRVHVRCQNAAEGFVFFAAPSSDADMTNKVLSLGSTAVAFGKRLVVLFDPDDQTSGPQFGCRADDCRPVLGIRLLR